MKPNRWWAALLFGASVLLHVAALVVFLGMLAPTRDKDGPSTAMEVVWIKTPTAPAPAPIMAPPPKVARAHPAPRRLRPPASVASRADDTLSAAPVAPVEQAQPAKAEPVFDREAALGAARKLANEKDPARAGTLSAALEARRELEKTEDEKLGATIASGKRNDCLGPNKNATLLTPLMWLFDKKGSGCKM